MVELTKEQQDFLDECEEEFKDRYTDKDESFMKTKLAESKKPPIIDPWHNAPQRANSWSRQNQGRDRRNRHRYGHDCSRDRERDRDRDRDKDRNRDRERRGERDREIDKSRDRERDRDSRYTGRHHPYHHSY